MADALLPDSESVLVTALKAQTAVTAIVGQRIATFIPPQPTWPLIRVVRVGGSPDQRWNDLPLLQVECWGADPYDRDAPELAARTVVSVLPDLQGSVSGGRIAGFDVFGSPLPAPDPDTGRQRWIVQVQLLTTG